MNPFKEMVAAVQFLTRITVWPGLLLDDRAMGRSMVYFPLVGLGLGGILALAGWGLTPRIAPLTAAVLILVLEIVITGGLHLDGLMDTADGLLSGREPGRMLEIMKDSRVGAMGAIALNILLLVKLALLVEIVSHSLWAAVVIAPVAGRLVQVLGVAAFPYVRAQGLGKLFAGHVGWSHLAAAALPALAVTLWLAPRTGTAALVLSIILAGMLYRLITRVIGGLTGDIYGAATEITEVLFLIAFLGLKL